MSFEAPGWLLLTGLTALVLVLHMRRRRELTVPSVILWRLLENTTAGRRSLRPPPPSLLLLLQLAIVAVTSIALAQPQFGGRAEAGHTIYVLDGSGSMRATDLVPSRFEAARARLTEMIVGLAEPGNRISVIDVDAQPRVSVARQTESSGILPIVLGLQAGDGAADWNAAKDLVAAVRREGEPTRIVILTDGADATAAQFEDAFPGITTRAIFAGTDNTNIGLTAAIAPVDAAAGQWKVTGTVRFSGAGPAEVVVDTRFQPEGTSGFVPSGTTTVARRGAGPNVAFDLVLTLPGPGAVQLELANDAGPHDNAAYFVVRRDPVRARVLYLGDPGGPLFVALQSLDFVDLVGADRLPANDYDLDLVVVDDVTVARRPATNVLWLGAARVAGEPPPAPLTAPYVTGWDTTHRLSDQIDWTVLAPNSGYAFERMPGATVLAEAGRAPLVQARTTPAGREVRIAAGLPDSGWADRPGLPVFVNNLVQWLGLDLGAVSETACVVGAACPIEPRFLSGTIAGPVGTAMALAGTELEFLVPGDKDHFVPTRAGHYTLRANGTSRLLAVNAMAESETALTPLDRETTDVALTAPDPLWWWLVATAFTALLAETWIAGTGAEAFLKRAALAARTALAVRRRVQLGLRLAGLGLLLGSLAGLPLLAREPAENIVVVVSPDLGPENVNPGRDRLLHEVETKVAASGNHGNTGLVAAGGAPRVAADLGGNQRWSRDQAFRGLAPGTNLEAATVLATAMLPADKAGRVVVATDGNETAGQVTRAIAAARARNIAIDIEPITELPPGEVLVESVTAPHRVYLGDTFLLDAVVYAQAPGKGHVTILRSGESVLEQELNLLAGRNRVETVVPARAVGNLVLEVSVAAPRDTFPQNNTNGVIVEVGGAPVIAIVTPDTVAGDYFSRALAVQGLMAKVISPGSAPKNVEGWLAYDSVVTMNLPAILLDTEQQESLEKFVQVHGRGLLILGGENTFGPGGYYGTAFERMSPLSSRIPHETPKVAIVFVLDRSGSMIAWADATRRYTRLDIAKEATLAAVAVLPDEARVGVVAFDHEAYVILPLQERKDEVAVARALSTLAPGGGTFIYPGLMAAMDMMYGIDVTARHIVVMTDGLSQTADFTELFAEAKRLGVTMSAIAVSTAADTFQPLLIAEGGGGGFYRTDDVRALPSILLQETLMLSSAPLKQVTAPVTWVDAAADFLTGLPRDLPPVHFYVRTTLKPQAHLHLAVTDDRGETEPLLASWRYGNGRVLAFTTHGAGSGTEDWLQLPDYPLLWAQAIRAFLPDARGPGLHLTLQRSGDNVQIAADVLDKAGAPITGRTVTAAMPDETKFVLPEVGPGRYERAATLPMPGIWRVDAAAGNLTASAMMYVGYPARFDFARADFDKLDALANSTGGHLLVANEPALREQMRWVARPGWRVWALLGLLLFVLDLTVRYAPHLLWWRLRPRTAEAAGAGARHEPRARQAAGA